MTSGAVRAFRNTHSNRHDAGFMKPHMIIVVSMSTVNMVSLRSQPRESPSCLLPSATRWLFAAGRMGGGVCVTTTVTGHSQESIGYMQWYYHRAWR